MMSEFLTRLLLTIEPCHRADVGLDVGCPCHREYGEVLELHSRALAALVHGESFGNIK
jgi:hypothetical protein